MSSTNPPDTLRALEAGAQNALAKRFAKLHRPGTPLVLANVYDAATARAVANHPSSEAVATASFAIAAVHGLADDDLTAAINLSAVATLAPAVHASGKPLTVDIQDGYADLAATVRTVIQLGAVGCNIEDVNSAARPPTLRDPENAAARIREVKRVAAALGVPDFVVNARTDLLLPRFAQISDANYISDDYDVVYEVVKRARQYLAAGATTVFVWGGPSRGLAADEVRQLVDRLGGMINVKMNLPRPGGPDFLDVQQIARLGVARVSVGPELFHRAMAGFAQGVDLVLGGAGVG